MNFLVVGLGSMGKRRIRCLQALGYKNVYGFDLRADRRKEAGRLYSVETFDDVEAAIARHKPNALVISVPPDVHHLYMKVAIKHGLHFFVEASVTDTDMGDIIAGARKAGVTAAPSSTLRFHPGIQLIGDIVRSGRLGTISNVMYHCGQFLPDWHTYEKVSDYYVSNPATGGAREIVPFELTWLLDIFGMPKKVFANVRKTIHIEGAEKIDDTYNCLLDFGSFLAVLTVDVVSRFATRRLTINGDKKQLRWDWDRNAVEIYDPETKKWESTSYEVQKAQQGYNANIGEKMYIDELKSFIDATQGGPKFNNTLEDDHAILRLLYAMERSDKASAVEAVR